MALNQAQLICVQNDFTVTITTVTKSQRKAQLMRIKMKRTLCIFLSLVLVMGLSTMMLTSDDHKFTVSKGHFLLYNVLN